MASTGISTGYQFEGDERFVGFSSRINPDVLPAGALAYAENTRLDRTTAMVRDGTLRVSDAALDNWITWGSCAFTDPTGVQKLVFTTTNLAGNASAFFIYTPAQFGQVSITQGPFNWPAGRIASAPVEMVQAGGKVFAMRGKQSTTQTAISSASAVGSNCTLVTTTAHGYSSGDEVVVSGVAVAAYNGYFVVNVVNQFTFTYSAFSSPGSSGSGGFTASGKALIVWDGLQYSTAGVSAAYSQSKFPSITDQGNANPPPADFGIYHQGRLILDFQKDKVAISDYYDPLTYDLTLNQLRINTGQNDEIVSFLPWIEDSFLVLQQRSVYLAYVDNSDSTTGTAPGVKSAIRLLSDQVGCIARKTAVTAGQRVFFLSQRGVQILTPQLNLTLTGETLPLSDPIDDIIQTINYDAVQYACAAYFNNRYWLAIPTGANARNDTLLVFNILNNAWESVDQFPPGFYVDRIEITTYSTGSANSKYVRPDGSSFYLRPGPNAGSTYLRSTNNGNSPRQRLHIITKEGGVFVCEENQNGDQIYSSVALPVLPFDLPAPLVPADLSDVPVVAAIETRSYGFKTLESKRYTKLQVATYGAGTLGITANVRDPDSSDEIGTIPITQGDGIRRLRLSGKGKDINVNLTITGSGSEVRQIFVSALPNSFQTVSAN